MSLVGRVAVVIGGARGIGKAYCDVLLNNGAKVVCADILESTEEFNVKEWTEKYGNTRALFVKCDVGRRGHVERKQLNYKQP